MIMEKIILVPVGGLANRMRAVASAVTLTYRVRRKLEVLWFRDWGLNAPFFKVFEEPELMNISFSETSCKHLLMYDRPRRRNFYLPKLFQKFQEMNIGWFFYIGGNDSMDTVLKLSDYAAKIKSDIRIIGVPKTIDNDLMITDHTPGFGSAAKYVATTMLEVAHDTYIYDIPSIVIVEIMGRDAGWLTASSVLARNQYSPAPHLIYLPEVDFDEDQFIEDIKKKLKTNRTVIIAVSEGIHDKDGNYISATSAAADKFGHAQLSGTGKALEMLVKERLSIKVRSIELNVLQRCSAHIASRTDINESFALGQAAVKYAATGKTGIMASINRISNDPYQWIIEPTDVANVANKAKSVPLEWITPEKNDVTEEMTAYLRPLIIGEVSLQYRDGLPAYLDVSHLNKPVVEE